MFINVYVRPQTQSLQLLIPQSSSVCQEKRRCPHAAITDIADVLCPDDANYNGDSFYAAFSQYCSIVRTHDRVMNTSCFRIESAQPITDTMTMARLASLLTTADCSLAAAL